MNDQKRTKPSSTEEDLKQQAMEPPEEEELGRLDDAVIGKAFRVSAIVAILLALMAVGIILVVKRRPPPAPKQITQTVAPVAADRTAAALPTVKFTDITASAGIRFVHQTGAYGEKLLPETMGGGVAFLDFDTDGDQDLLFINGTAWPWRKQEKAGTPALYRNDGKGSFTDVTSGSGLDVSLYGMGMAIGDYDNDGLEDILLTGVGGSRLFHNEGTGKFVDVTRQAGVGGKPEDWTTSAAWIDYDNDGLLDLFVCNYVRWSREIDAEVGYKIDGVTRAYGPPMNFQGTFSYLFHNEGKGVFKDVSSPAGVQVKNTSTGVPAGKSLGVCPIDFDNDGWIDLAVANDTTPNFLFHNQKNGTFKEIGGLAGLAYDSRGNTRGAMGMDSAYYRNDDGLAIAIGNFANEENALYVSRRALPQFTDDALPEGVGPASRLLLKFGLFFFDYDLDSRVDLLTCNGHLEEEISKIQKSQTYAQPAQLFWNASAGAGPAFVPVASEKAGADLFKPIVGRGSAYGDIDGDGDLDVVLAQAGGAPLLLRNDQQLTNNWLRLKLEGSKANRSAIGARVRVHLGNQVLTRNIIPAKSYLSHSELPLTIGLGKQDKPSQVEIIWPGGKVQKLAEPRLNGLTLVKEEI